MCGFSFCDLTDLVSTGNKCSPPSSCYSMNKRDLNDAMSEFPKSFPDFLPSVLFFAFFRLCFDLVAGIDDRDFHVKDDHALAFTIRHIDIIYKRLSPKGNIDFGDLFLNMWCCDPSVVSNYLSIDFKLHSSFEDHLTAHLQG